MNRDADFYAVLHGAMTADEFAARHYGPRKAGGPVVLGEVGPFERSMRRAAAREADRLAERARRWDQATIREVDRRREQQKLRKLAADRRAIRDQQRTAYYRHRTQADFERYKAPPPTEPVEARALRRYLAGTIDTIEFLMEYDRLDVPCLPYISGGDVHFQFERMNEVEGLALEYELR